MVCPSTQGDHNKPVSQPLLHEKAGGEHRPYLSNESVTRCDRCQSGLVSPYVFHFYEYRVFNARRHASAIYGVVVSVTSRCSNETAKCLGSGKQYHTIAQRLQLSDVEDLGKTQTGSLATEAPNAVKIGDFRQITRYNSKTSTVASVVILVRSQVYRTKRPPLFAARLPQCSALRGSVSDS